MLKVGQFVTINRPPSFGRYFFDERNVGRRVRVAQIYKRNGGELQYRMSEFANECLWLEGELTPHDKYHFSSRNRFDVGDTVIVDETEHTITSAYKVGYGYAYELDHKMYVTQRQIKPLEPKYTLF